MSEEKTEPTRYIKPEEIAEDLQISRAAAYRLAAKIPAVRLDRTIRIERTDYETWLQEQKRIGGGR
jgi:predicted DNA-binding transcriptional regulator AlpA